MNAIVPVQRTKVEVYVGEVLPPDRLSQVMASLPSHVKPERFERNLVVAVTQHPKLLQCDPAAVFNEVSKAAALGLYLDPQLGEAYLITGGGWAGGPALTPQLRLGYRGLSKLARQSGDLKGTPYAHEVYDADVFEAVLGTDKKLAHKPDFTKDRGKVILYYAAVKFEDGETDFEIMSIPQIHRIRDRSDGWRAFKAGKIKSTPWSTDEEEMAKKTVLRRLLKRLPQSPEIADALGIDDADFREPIESAPRQSIGQRLGGPVARPGFSLQHVQRETGAAAEFAETASEPAACTVAEGGETALQPPPQSESDFPGDQPPPSRQEVQAFLFESADEFAKDAPGYLTALQTRSDLDAMWAEWGPDLRRLRTADPTAAAHVVQLKKAAAVRLEAAS